MSLSNAGAPAVLVAIGMAGRPDRWSGSFAGHHATRRWHKRVYRRRWAGGIQVQTMMVLSLQTLGVMARLTSMAVTGMAVSCFHRLVYFDVSQANALVIAGGGSGGSSYDRSE